jgi:hypothetical protein
MTKAPSHDTGPAGAAGSLQTPQDAPSRRSLLLGIAAGTVAAGSFAANATAEDGCTTGAAAARKSVRIVFDARRSPTLDDVNKAIAAAAGFAGCTCCGLDGIDIEMVQQEILGPDPTPFLITAGPTPQPAGF